MYQLSRKRNLCLALILFLLQKRFLRHLLKKTQTTSSATSSLTAMRTTRTIGTLSRSPFLTKQLAHSDGPIEPESSGPSQKLTHLIYSRWAKTARISVQATLRPSSSSKMAKYSLLLDHGVRSTQSRRLRQPPSPSLSRLPLLKLVLSLLPTKLRMIAPS